MTFRVAVASLVAVLLLGCGVQIDLTGLQFEPEGTGAEDVPPAEELSVPEGELPCAFFYHCLIESIEDGADPGDCLDDVTPSEKVRVGAVENCRKKVCVKQDQIPGSPSFKPEELMKCVGKSCWSEMLECAIGHGDATCYDFAGEYRELVVEKTAQCDEPAIELCVLEELYAVSADETPGVDSFLNCVINQYRYGQPFESCVTLCGVGL
jgi:hypothetical protein